MRRAKSLLVLMAGAMAAVVWGTGGCGSDGSTGSDPAADRVPPAAPAVLQVDKIGDGEVWLSWNPTLDDTGSDPAYVVYRAAGAAEPVSIDTTYRAAYQDVGLEYETEYTYHVIAVDAAGNRSGPSPVAGGQPFNNLAPLAPTGLRAFAHNLTVFAQQTVDISLDWDANLESDLREYRLYRDTNPGFALDEGTLRAEIVSPRFVDENVEVGVTYYYKVIAVDRGGKESQVSQEVNDTPLPAATLLEPVDGEPAPAVPTFRWEPVVAAVTYHVIVTTSPTSGEISSIPLTEHTSATFRGRALDSGDTYQLESGEVYYWKVIASTRINGQENSVSGVERFKVR